VSGGLTGTLATFAAGLPGAAIPESAREAAARSLLDTLACGVAGLAEASTHILLEVIGQEATAGPCTVLGLARRLAPREAALINGAAAHALDFDDTHDEAVLHPGVAVIPAALAAAEYRAASGPDLLDAIVVGYDVHVRVALAATQAPGLTGWHYTSACGIFGAAAAAGRLLGLEAERMASAFGLAFAQASGTLQSEHDGTWTKRLQPGLAAGGGVLAAQLAARGFRGPGEALEGTYGFYRVYLREFDPAPVLTGLGQRFEVERTSLKPFPTCRFTHAPAAALQELMQREGLRPGDLDRIEAHITGAAYAEVCEPIPQKLRPASRVHAQFSLPYALACVADHGTIDLADLTEPAIRRPEVLALAERVCCVRDPELEAAWAGRIGEAEVRVQTRDGVAKKARATPPGGSLRPLSQADRLAKAKDCLAWGGADLDASELTHCITALRYDGTVADLSRLLQGTRIRSRQG
jgi:2-methylcitrate dehydratase PrpD